MNHLAIHNQMTFDKDGVQYDIIECVDEFVEGAEEQDGKLVWGKVLVPVIKFRNGNKEYSMEEGAFWRKVGIRELKFRK